ncbi:Zinc finger, TFIIB-type domain protein [Thermoproteus uzoniensis 768-20]|uniref:Zinc finger, TFIIB-type domain protein n=1 Tax=Thermoproteus uzoniensis (strain 768-20) TaxID=999630 RepID=F2L1C4_THEU7|nr:transcription initiation factor IIB family protein [Thermoproteus uzoniensis]AEA12860.1 Zinc finger, TFIIB-type domain protein [Thermoproteus uzoniensis 768-20]
MTRRILAWLAEQDLVCPNCGAVNKVRVDYEQGVIVCTECGTVIREGIVDLGPEWRRPESSRAFVGASGTELGDVERGVVKISDKLRALRLKRAAKPITSASERLEIDMREFYDSLRELLGIPRAIIDEAVALYKKAYEMGFRSPRREGYAAALYFAVKRHGVGAVTYRSLVEKAGLDRGAFMSAYMEFLRYMAQAGEKMPKVDPRVYIPRIVSALGLDGELGAQVQRIAAHLLSYIIRSPRIRNGRKPQVLAAVAVYFACFISGIEVTQKDVARAAESTETPIRDLLNELADLLYIELYV